MKNELRDVIKAVKSYIELEKEFGVEEFISKRAPEADGSLTPEQHLEALRKDVVTCRCCSLAGTRTNVVFGAGSARARLMFIGEAPGADEDKQGLPFVGRAGQLLTKIIEAMGMKREDVYIANILKCRPPNNRPPLPEEIKVCGEVVRRQISIINPTVICTLGKFASQTLLNTETPISQLRGNFYEYHGINVMPTFHPAYLLRNPDDKRLVWSDMKKIKRLL